MQNNLKKKKLFGYQVSGVRVSQKKQNTMAEESNRRIAEDRIRNLPDGLLNLILSRVPTKTAVATGRLSYRRSHLWKHLSILNFSDHSYSYLGQQSERFKSFSLLVNSVLLVLLGNPRAIQKITLDCAHSTCDDYQFREYSVDMWVRVVVGPHLEELNLAL